MLGTNCTTKNSGACPSISVVDRERERQSENRERERETQKIKK